MYAPTSPSASTDCNLTQSPASPSSSLPANGTASLRTVNSNSSSSSRALPTPPAVPGIPPPKIGSWSHHNGAGKKGKGKENGRKQENGKARQEDEDWTLEEPSTEFESAREQAFQGAKNKDKYQLREPSIPLTDSQLTEMPLAKEGKRKESKGRILVKKTSQIFSRDRRHREKSDNSTSLHLPSTSRQTSYSSVTSSDSYTTNGSSRNYGLPLSRPPSHPSQHSSYSSKSHGRRQSQDSQTSWRQTTRSSGSGSTSTHVSSPDVAAPPIPHRQGSQLSASVPTLSRNNLPQPASGPSGSRAPDTFPTRMSTWFSHLLPSSSSNAVPDTPDSSRPEVPNLPASPQRRGPSAAASFLNAARQKAVDGVRHLLDSEAQPDKCPDTIWVMGVAHPGWRPTTPIHDTSQEVPETVETKRRGSSSSGKPSPPSKGVSGALKPSGWGRRQESSTSSAVSPPPKGIGTIFGTSSLSLGLSQSVASSSPVKDDLRGSTTDSPSKGKKGKAEKEIIRWPDQFYDDFRSRVWCTYRSQYAPILSLPNNLLLPTPETYFSAFGPPADLPANLPGPHSFQAQSLPSRPSTSPWSWSRSADERGLTSDAGWGCMLRTGQSMLANALINLHLGREWRPPLEKPNTSPESLSDPADLEAYASYVKIISWFLDDPSPLCPFSVHRMALIGKELGKEVGEWFGPSTASGALKTLTNSFPLCGLAVASATDSMIYKSDVYAASNLPSNSWTDEAGSSRRGSADSRRDTWGSKAVLILVGLRLGLDGVNPTYYETIKALFTFPQSVGIAGGRPSSSYYFVGSQAGSLFYLDPHLTRPAVPLETPPSPPNRSDAGIPARSAKVEVDEEVIMVDQPEDLSRDSPVTVPYTLDVVDVDDLSSDSDTSSSLAQRRRRPTSMNAAKRLSLKRSATPPPPRQSRSEVTDTPSTPLASARRRSSGSGNASSSPLEPAQSSFSGPPAQPNSMDPMTKWYVDAYSETQLRTFHCEKVKKIPLSGLDPSMLLGFLCKDQQDFDDFCARVSMLPQKIFTVQDEPPSWDADDDAGLESVSEPEIDDFGGSNSPDADDEDLDDILVSANTTMDAIEVDPSTNGPFIPQAAPLRSTDDEEWVTKLERQSLSSTRPVLVETPSEPVLVSRPSDEMVDQISKPVRGTAASLLHRPGAGEMERMRTESWVRPEKDGVAPNGASAWD